MKDRLYLLKPNFLDKGQGPFFCGECAVVEGMLGFFPELRRKLDVHYIDFERPRPKLVEELGADHQSAPVLVLGELPEKGVPRGVTIKQAKGKPFIDNEHEICNYLAAVHQVGRIHHPVKGRKPTPLARG